MATLLISIDLNAQVQGIIQDAISLEPLPNVSIVVKGTNTGTQTANDGSFSLSVKQFPAALQISYLGYESAEVSVSSEEAKLVISLNPVLTEMDELVISDTRVNNPLTNTTPISRTSIRVEQISMAYANTGVELLRAKPGIFIQQTSVGQGSIYIRGRAGRDVLYLFNGLRMNPSFVRSGQNQYFGVIDPLLVNQIDVYRGPVSVFYGSDAMSGGVNISPRSLALTDNKDFGVQVKSALNAEGNGEKTIHGNLSYVSPKFTLFAGGSYRDFDYYHMSSKSNDALWFPYDNTLSNADYQFKSYLLSSRLKTSPASDISLLSYFGTIPDAPRFDRITLGFDIEKSEDTYTPRNAYFSNTSPLSLRANILEYRFRSDASIIENMEFKIGYFKLKDHRRSADFAFNDSPRFSFNQSLVSSEFSVSDTIDYDRNTSDLFLAALDFRSKLSDKFYLKWGADLSYDVTSSERFSSSGDQFLSRYPDGSKYLQTGLFVQLDQVLHEDLNIEYGIRYSHAFADLPFEGFNSDRGYAPYSTNFGQLTGSIGISYDINSDLKLVNNISTGFRAPNIADLSEVGNRGSGLFQTPTIGLKPEKTFNYDLGLRFNTEKLGAEFVAYWLHYFDKINQERTGNIVDEFGNFITDEDREINSSEFYEVNNQNVNSMNLLGIEFFSDYYLNDQFTTGLSFTYNWGKLKNVNGELETVNRIPPANGQVYVNYQITDQLLLKPQARYAFEKRNLSPEEINDVRVSRNGTDGFVNYQVLMSYMANENLVLTFFADNLTDIAYRDHASSLDGMGRNFTLSVSYTF